MSVDMCQFRMGMKVEREHTDVVANDPDGAMKSIARIVLAHLKEDPQYYTKLTRIEKSLQRDFHLEGGQGSAHKGAHKRAGKAGAPVAVPRQKTSKQAPTAERKPEDPDNIRPHEMTHKEFKDAHDKVRLSIVDYSSDFRDNIKALQDAGWAVYRNLNNINRYYAEGYEGKAVMPHVGLSCPRLKGNVGKREIKSFPKGRQMTGNLPDAPSHRFYVMQAVEQHRYVSPEVLAEYPDIAEAYKGMLKALFTPTSNEEVAAMWRAQAAACGSSLLVKSGKSFRLWFPFVWCRSQLSLFDNAPSAQQPHHLVGGYGSSHRGAKHAPGKAAEKTRGITPASLLIQDNKYKEPWEMTWDEWSKVKAVRSGRLISFENTNGKIFATEKANAVQGSGRGIEYYRDRAHRAAIWKALLQGKPVPPQVLAEYPDLKGKIVAKKKKPEPKKATGEKVVTAHGREVKRALAEGKQVPPEVLADYPELAAKEAAFSRQPDKLIFNEEYDGPRHTYGMKHRPPGYGNIPKGFIIGSDKPHHKFTYGTIDYSVPLTQHEKDSYELTSVDVNADLLPPIPDSLKSYDEEKLTDKAWAKDMLKDLHDYSKEDPDNKDIEEAQRWLMKVYPDIRY